MRQRNGNRRLHGKFMSNFTLVPLVLLLWQTKVRNFAKEFVSCLEFSKAVTHSRESIEINQDIHIFPKLL